jgi:hypothetical protein
VSDGPGASSIVNYPLRFSLICYCPELAISKFVETKTLASHTNIWARSLKYDLIGCQPNECESL